MDRGLMAMRFENGWIKLWRMDDLDWLNRDINAKRIWIEILLHAANDSGEFWNGCTYEKHTAGELQVLINRFSKSIGLSTYVFLSRLKFLEDDGLISIVKKDGNTLLVRVNNWDLFKGDENQ